jgi:hypothetical protein
VVLFRTVSEYIRAGRDSLERSLCEYIERGSSRTLPLERLLLVMLERGRLQS